MAFSFSVCTSRFRKLFCDCTSEVSKTYKLIGTERENKAALKKISIPTKRFKRLNKLFKHIRKCEIEKFKDQ
jgi:hypothetical protein